MDLPSKQLEGEVCPPVSSLQVEKLPAVVWTTDSRLQITSLAGSGLSTTNLRLNDFIGRPLEDFLRGLESDARPLAAHHQALAGGASSFDIGIMGRDLRAHVEPVHGADRAVVGVIGVAVDNTEYQVAERALRLSEQSYRSLFEQAPFAICRSTLGGDLLQVNPAMVEMLGYESEPELLLRSMTSEIFPDQESYGRFLVKFLGPEPCQGFECAWQCQDGKTVLVRLGGRAVRDDAGHIFYLEILAENITERKKLEEELRQGQKLQAIGQLAGGIAHDFNNLLTVIRGRIDLMLSEAAPGTPLRSSLDEAQKAAERASRLTQQLLAFGRRQVLQTRILDLNQVIGGINQMLSRIIGPCLELRFTPGTDLAMVKADPSQMEQVLVNLVLNARDAMPNGGKVIIQTGNVRLDAVEARRRGVSEPGDYVMLLVQDTGTGMDLETQSHVFEPFFTTKKVGEGTGLGLATVYGIIQQSGGYIWLQSAPGQGARFEIYLPTVEGVAEPAVIAERRSFPRGKETILLVEDDAGVRDLISIALQRAGYKVLLACDGASAEETALGYEGKIDLLVSDLIMPRMGGHELAQRLQRKLPDLKVIFISGFAGAPALHDSILSTRIPVLQKPVSMQYLTRAIRQFLEESSIPAREDE